MTKQIFGRILLIVALAVLGAVGGLIMGGLGALLLTDCNIVEGECNWGFLLGAVAGAILIPTTVFWFGLRARWSRRQN